MLTKSPCQHCGTPLEFEAEHAGQFVDCPACGQSTRLVLPRPAAPPATPPKPIPTPKPVQTPPPEVLIEDSLKGWAEGFVVIGVVSAALSGFGTLIALANERGEEAGIGLVFAVVFLLYGFFMRALLRGAVEVIWQLRSISKALQEIKK